MYAAGDGVDGWRGLWFVALVFGVSRIFYLGAGAVLSEVVPVHPFQERTRDVPYGSLSLWSHWDGEHYVGLALEGYLGGEGQVSPAFFPMYSLVLRSLAELLGGPLTLGALSVLGVLVSMLALFFAFYFVYEISAAGWGEAVARRTVLALAFFPTAFFLNSVYTESLFLALSAGAVWAARVRRDLLLAALLGALATATRNVGVFLLLPLVHEWLRDPGGYRWRGAYLALVPAGLFAYMAYLWWRFGEPLLFYTDQSRWGREAAGPLASMGGAFAQAFEEMRSLVRPGNLPEFEAGEMADYLASATDTLNLLFLLVAAALLAVGILRLPWGLAGYAALVAFLPAFFGTAQSPLMGFPRYVIVAFPLFIALGLVLKNRALLAIWLVASGLLSLALCAMFVSWRFVA
jgi:hypothetical protein